MDPSSIYSLIWYMDFIGIFLCLVGCFGMIIWTPTLLSVLYACVLYFCICTCSAQLSMFHMERHSRNTLIIIIITTDGSATNAVANGRPACPLPRRTESHSKCGRWKALLQLPCRNRSSHAGHLHCSSFK